MIFNRAAIKNKSREQLSNNLNCYLSTTITYFVIAIIIGLLQKLIDRVTGIETSILSWFTSPLLTYGLIVAIRYSRDTKNSGVNKLFSGFGKYSIKILIVTLARNLFPIFLVIAYSLFAANATMYLHYGSSAIVAENLYGMLIFFGIVVVVVDVIFAYMFYWVTYIVIDNPDMDYLEILTESRKLTKGNRWSLFVYDLSWIWWSLLAVITCGLGLIYFIPYRYLATLNLYEQFRDKDILINPTTLENINETAFENKQTSNDD